MNPNGRIHLVGTQSGGASATVLRLSDAQGGSGVLGACNINTYWLDVQVSGSSMFARKNVKTWKLHNIKNKNKRDPTT